MRYKKYTWLMVLLSLLLLLSACTLGQEPEPTLDTGAIFTAAVETIAAQFSAAQTQTALAVPPTPLPTNTPIPTFALESPTPGFAVASPFPSQPGLTTPLATSTPLAALATQSGPVCMDSAWIQDVTYIDYPEPPTIQDDQYIEKIWRVQNSGTCTWDDGFALVPVTGNAKGSWVIDKTNEFVDPGEIVDISIDIYTGTVGGEQGGCWRMKGDNDYYFGTLLCFKYIVK